MSKKSKKSNVDLGDYEIADKLHENILNLYRSFLPSAASYISIFPFALFASALPVYLYQSIHEMTLEANMVVFGICTLGASIALTYASAQRQSFMTAVRLIRGERVTADKRYINAFLLEAKWFSVAFINAQFLTLAVILGFFAFAGLDPLIAYGGSMVLSAGLVAVLNTGDSMQRYKDTHSKK